MLIYSLRHGEHRNASDENPGEMSERFKELVLKTSDSERGRGFESHPLRHQNLNYYLAWRSTQVAEEDGLLNR